MRFLLVLLTLCFSLYFFYQRSYRACYTCKNNQVLYANLLVLWRDEHHGAYPESLAQLREYVTELPTCPATGSAPDYRRGENYFALACLGENHPGLLPANCPAYTATRGPLGWKGPPEAQPRVPWMLWAAFVVLFSLSHPKRFWPTA